MEINAQFKAATKTTLCQGKFHFRHMQASLSFRQPRMSPSIRPQSTQFSLQSSTAAAAAAAALTIIKTTNNAAYSLHTHKLIHLHALMPVYCVHTHAHRGSDSCSLPIALLKIHARPPYASYRRSEYKTTTKRAMRCRKHLHGLHVQFKFNTKRAKQTSDMQARECERTTRHDTNEECELTLLPLLSLLAVCSERRRRRQCLH